MSDLTDFLFGGQDSSAQDAQLGQNQISREEMSRRAERAREDVLRLFPDADSSLRQGILDAIMKIESGESPRVEALREGLRKAEQVSAGGLSDSQNLLSGANPTQEGRLALRGLTESLLADTETPLAVRANLLLDEAQKQGLDAQGLADFTGLSLTEIQNGLELTGRTLGPRTDVATGLRGSEDAIAAGLQDAKGTIGGAISGANSKLNQARDTGVAAIDEDIGRALGGLDTFSGNGRNASDMLAALNGLQGPEAQKQAIATFMKSPETAFVQDQGEQSVLRSAAALGGLGGGNVQKDLVRFGQGLASTRFENYANRLSGDANRGLSSASTQGGFLTSGAGMKGNLIGSTGIAGAGIQADLGRALGGMQADAGALIGNNRSLASQILAGQSGARTNLLTGATLDTGMQESNIYGDTTSNIANLLSGGGQASAELKARLAALLSNIEMGAGTQYGSLPSIPGVQNTPGAITGMGQFAGGIGGFLQGLG